MTFQLTDYIEQQRRAKLVAAIKTGARMISECQDERKQWRAMCQLRKLQLQLKSPVL
jgi:hypothetical protein